MITAFIGSRGSGKTLTMTIEAYKKYRQGYKIFSNYHLNFPYTPYDIDDLMMYAEEGRYFGNAIFLIDELHIYFDARASGKKRNRIFSYFINQSSKNDIDIMYTTQFSRQVEIRLRLNTEIVVESVGKSLVWKTKGSKPVVKQNYRPKPNDYRVLTYIENVITMFSDTGADKVARRKFKANDFFKLYDTREVVKMQKDVFDRQLDERKNNPKVKKELSDHKASRPSYKETREYQKQNRKVNEAERERLRKEYGEDIL